MSVLELSGHSNQYHLGGVGSHGSIPQSVPCRSMQQAIPCSRHAAKTQNYGSGHWNWHLGHQRGRRVHPRITERTPGQHLLIYDSWFPDARIMAVDLNKIQPALYVLGEFAMNYRLMCLGFPSE